MNPYARTLESALSRTTSSADEVVRTLGQAGRCDLAGAPHGSLALVLSQAWRKDGRPTLLITPTAKSASSLARDLRFFNKSGQQAPPPVLLYPSADTSPYLPVAPDRRAMMDRMHALATMVSGQPWSFIVAPVDAALSRVPPRPAVQKRCIRLRVGDIIERDQLTATLVEAGYMNTPVAEDAGTFAVRGGIIDIFPTAGDTPARIDIDDICVAAIKSYDADTQRTTHSLDTIHISPGRVCLMGEAERENARPALRDLCGAVNYPSTKTADLVDDFLSGRSFPGAEGFLPALYPALETLFDFLPTNVRIAIQDPSHVGRRLSHTLSSAAQDQAARMADGAPAFPPDALFMSSVEWTGAVSSRRPLLNHTLTIYGQDEDAHDDEAPEDWARFIQPPSDEVKNIGGLDQHPLRSAIKNQRAKHGGEGSLQPLVGAINGWLEDGMRVMVTARSRTQGDRISSLLLAHTLTPRRPASFSTELLRAAPSGKPEIVVGDLAHGFSLAPQGVVFVTEADIFGERRHRRRKRQQPTRNADAFLQDLRQLAVDDYVVHVQHGIGRYLGLERKHLGQTQLDRMRGLEPPCVEVLVVEYAGGDKLFLPVTRLNQIQKFSSGDGNAPKVDKLGGQSFARTKAKASKKVKDIADQLLRLYAERANSARPPLRPPGTEYAEFEATFPFEETRDQQRAIDDVLSDLEGGKPMDRLVCGDVGFGKTEVALRAAFRVALSGKQVAVLCPTTVLAQQHLQTFRTRFSDYPVHITALSRFVDRKAQKETLLALKEGAADIVVGTHRLLSKDVHFKDLGLLVVDEEQRFGVTHKERIKELRRQVDVLTLTATPIPRTLQMAVGGLRELSLIATPPVDRRAVRTFVCRWDDQLIADAIRREVRRGGQVFFVYNRIEGLYERGQRLQEMAPEARIAVAHGQLKEALLEKVMVDFVDGQYDVLCSTAIVESGLDIPRANTIIIDRADMFGLAQLYQLRGRVGRSPERAYCYLITPPEARLTDEARFRMQALERFTELGSGFQVASLDLELRGAGDLLGAEQSGAVAAVGMDIFVRMLRDAVAALEGKKIVHEIDPELSIDGDLHVPESYVEDVGVRLSLYKRLASAQDDESIDEIATELEDRFGPAPPAARRFVRAMRLRPRLRALHVLGCEASAGRVGLHLRKDTPLDPQKIMSLVTAPKSVWKLSPDMKLVRRFADKSEGPLSRVEEVLNALERLSRPKGESE